MFPTFIHSLEKKITKEKKIHFFLNEFLSRENLKTAYHVISAELLLQIR